MCQFPFIPFNTQYELFSLSCAQDFVLFICFQYIYSTGKFGHVFLACSRLSLGGVAESFGAVELHIFECVQWIGFVSVKMYCSLLRRDGKLAELCWYTEQTRPDEWFETHKPPACYCFCTGTVRCQAVSVGCLVDRVVIRSVYIVVIAQSAVEGSMRLKGWHRKWYRRQRARVA